MDDPESVEGMEAHAAWGDEVGKMKAGSWETITGRLSVTKGPCIITTTPYASGWFYRDIFLKGLEGDENYENITWSSIDNPAFPQDEFERKRRELPRAIFERRYLGKFTRLEGLVYPEFEEDVHVIEPFDIPDDWVRFGGLDFGYSNPNAIVCIAEDPNTRIFYVYKEFYQNEILLKNISNFLKDQGLSYVLADTQSAQLIAELRNFYDHKEIKEADKAIDVGIQRIRTLLSEKRLKFFREVCKNTLEEIETYHYPPPNPDKVFKDKPVPKKNHAMDALRYSFSRPIQGLYLNRKRSKVDNSKRQRLMLRRRNLNPYTGY
jgi:PBSX family phage terminase large subunit